VGLESGSRTPLIRFSEEIRLVCSQESYNFRLLLGLAFFLGTD